MKVLRKLFRAMPKPTTDGAFSPSPLGIKLGASSKTNFDGGAHAKRFDGKQNRILMICTEEHQMIMANGNKFSTGNHPVEMALPMLHLINAGFEIDVVTPTGAPVAIEMWAMPEDDTDIKKLFSDFESVFRNPGSLVDFVANRMLLDPMHAAIFIPGGHGSMLGLPHNPDLGKVLHGRTMPDCIRSLFAMGPQLYLLPKTTILFYMVVIKLRRSQTQWIEKLL